MITGIVLASVGGIGFIGGSVLFSDGQDKTPIYCETSMGTTLCGRQDDSGRVAGGVALMIIGGLGVGVGIPLAIWGGSRAKPELRVGASSASLTWRY
jgi:hypothetical protein